MKNISFKLGALFLAVVLFIHGVLFIFLYTGLLHNRIEDEKKALLARGNSHRDVLEHHFDDMTLKHVALMESEAETKVAVTDANNRLLVYSKPFTEHMKQMIKKKPAVSGKGAVIQGSWRDHPYLVTASPIYDNEKRKGYVYMFAPTASIRSLVDKLTSQFLLAAFLTFVLSIILVFFLSKFITMPIINLKQITKEISRGKHHPVPAIKRADELGELAASIQSLSNDLERLKKERNDFLASIAHELRTPLTYLKGYADIATRPIDEKERLHYLHIIKEEAENLALLVKELFELAKMDKNQFAITKEKVRMDELLTEIYEKIEPVFNEEEKSLGLIIEPVWACVDEKRFSQVIYNFLDNALKHTNKGGRVEIRLTKEKGTIKLAISDNGEGIPKEDVPYIFERLYRVDKSRSRLRGGSGLGLSIAKEIIERHGGTIRVQSQSGKGTTFIITIRGEAIE